MGKVWRVISLAASALVLLAFAFGSGFYLATRRGEKTEVVEKEVAAFDMALPREVEKRVVTVEEVSGRLVEISQFSTYSEEYNVSKSADYTRYLLNDIPVPGTTNTVAINCSGIVKVGYDVSSITPTVDNESRTIYISLPTPAVLDNYVIWDSVNCTEANNILNPIDFSQYQTMIAEIEDMGLAQAESDGIYKAAEDNIKVVIQSFLAGFDEYEIVFI